MMLRMGLRSSELCSLCWENIDLVNGTIVLRRKREDVRELPLESECSAALSSIGCRHVSQREALVFSQSGRPFTRRILERMLEKHSREAKIPKFTLHAFRHTYATRLAQAGASPFELATLLGHKRLDVMKSYFMHSDKPDRATFADQAQSRYMVRRTTPGKRGKTDFSI